MTFAGVLTALVTPFDDRGAVDERTFRGLVRRQLDAGIDGLVPCGTTGESPTLSAEEQLDVIRWTVEESGGRAPVLAGVGGNNTAAVIENARRAQEVGVQGVLCTTPYYNKPSQEGLYRHFKAIAEAVPDLEICVYDVPGRTSLAVHTETLGRLMGVSNVTCVKDATADLAKAGEIARLIGTRDFAMLSGDDFTTVPFVAAGGHGCISVASNLIPQEMVAMVGAARRGDFSDAARRSADLQPLFRAMFTQTNPLPIKTMMAAKGLCGGTFRLPLCPMDDGPKQAALAVMQEFGHLR